MGLVGEVEHPSRGPLKVLNQPVAMSGAAPVLRAPAPEAGEHSDELLAELGLSAAEIANLKERKIA